jgi:RNA polymerase sigma-70 factor (ECF subfamily)
MLHCDGRAELSGEQLFHLFLEGDEEALEKLIVLYKISLTWYINGFLNDMRQSEELMIDAFAELAADTRFKSRSSLKTYLFAIGRHLALRSVKKYKSAVHISLDEIADSYGGDENTVEEDYLDDEEKRQLHAVMGKLKPEYHEALRLVYFEDMSYADAGTVMRKTEKQMKNLIYSAKVSLRKAYDGKEAAI